MAAGWPSRYPLPFAYVTFPSITLAIGDSFYDEIAVVRTKTVSMPNAVDVPWSSSLARPVSSKSMRLITVSAALISMPLLTMAGFPVVGQQQCR